MRQFRYYINSNTTYHINLSSCIGGWRRWQYLEKLNEYTLINLLNYYFQATSIRIQFINHHSNVQSGIAQLLDDLKMLVKFCVAPVQLSTLDDDVIQTIDHREKAASVLEKQILSLEIANKFNSIFYYSSGYFLRDNKEMVAQLFRDVVALDPVEDSIIERFF